MPKTTLESSGGGPGNASVASPAAIHSGTLYCENCGRSTEHRILAVPRRASGSAPTSLSGVARCRICHWIHPFRSARSARVVFDEILSEGPHSTRRTRSMAPDDIVEVGVRLPRVDPALRVLRIDRRDGSRPESAMARSIATLWVAPDDGAIVPVSFVEGRRTRSVRLRYDPTQRLEVGATLESEGRSYRIAGLRARGQTWRLEGDGFPAGEVDRVYAKRTLSPPAGNIAWSRDRGSPNLSASSISRSARERSSPGRSRA
ncbi:MAG TPA: HVO_0476 family zinc finger protein, partial [Thermoplasmata archaeon]|nr:HVO_0476 family zinc finger protein [Thermoplasmata archaeon]